MFYGVPFTSVRERNSFVALKCWSMLVQVYRMASRIIGC